MNTTRDMFSLKLLKDPTFHRFLLVGCSNFLIASTMFWLAFNAPWESEHKAAIAQVMSYSLAVLWSYYWNRRVTFKQTGPVRRQMAKFIILQLSFLAFSSIMIGIGVDRMGLNPKLTWLVVMSFVTLANYWLMRLWVFR